MGRPPTTYVVEHLDDEVGPWSALEYKTIAQECAAGGAKFILSSVPLSLILPSDLQDVPGFQIENESVEEVYADQKGRVCLLDPAAKEELCPADVEMFDVFLFGGILGQLLPAIRE